MKLRDMHLLNASSGLSVLPPPLLVPQLVPENGSSPHIADVAHVSCDEFSADPVMRASATCPVPLLCTSCGITVTLEQGLSHLPGPQNAGALPGNRC